MVQAEWYEPVFYQILGIGPISLRSKRGPAVGGVGQVVLFVAAGRDLRLVDDGIRRHCQQRIAFGDQLSVGGDEFGVSGGDGSLGSLQLGIVEIDKFGRDLRRCRSEKKRRTGQPKSEEAKAQNGTVGHRNGRDYSAGTRSRITAVPNQPSMAMSKRLRRPASESWSKKKRSGATAVMSRARPLMRESASRIVEKG